MFSQSSQSVSVPVAVAGRKSISLFLRTLDLSVRSTEYSHMKERTMVGAYGEWARSLPDDPGSHSVRHPDHTDVDRWCAEARNRLETLLARPDTGTTPAVSVEATYEYDGLHVEELQWSLPYGPPTDAVFLKPADADGQLPGVLALHGHSGSKYFGRRKIAATDRLTHPLMAEHQEDIYGGVAWANQLAKRGYGVLVHDGFGFASRRVRLGDVPEAIRGDLPAPSDADPEAITVYDEWAADHESTMAKSLFAAGTTWPGVFLGEDQRALDVLCSRADVNSSRVGCGGLSGGGLRTVFLAGLDDRIRSSVCAGMMTTWRDFLLHRSGYHTWMCFLPRCPNLLEYPEILGLQVPTPTLVLNNADDHLFTMAGMERADEILASVYEQAGVRDQYRCSFYDGPHKFDREMQREAFEWFDETLA